MTHHPNKSSTLRLPFKPLRFVAATTLLALLLFCSPVFAVNKDMVQLQTQIQQLQDAVARQTDYWEALLGGAILLLVIAFPQGIVGFVQDKLGSHRKGDGGVASQPAKEAL